MLDCQPKFVLHSKETWNEGEIQKLPRVQNWAIGEKEEKSFRNIARREKDLWRNWDSEQRVAQQNFEFECMPIFEILKKRKKMLLREFKEKSDRFANLVRKIDRHGNLEREYRERLERGGDGIQGEKRF